MSHGLFLPISATVWIITSTVVASAVSRSAVETHRYGVPWNNSRAASVLMLKPYARFPGGNSNAFAPDPGLGRWPGPAGLRYRPRSFP